MQPPAYLPSRNQYAPKSFVKIDFGWGIVKWFPGVNKEGAERTEIVVCYQGMSSLSRRKRPVTV
ncbi:MAG: hypothetical protein M2R45_00973 [Verrucomicrobia subdivision 3 bacterium]|nr:hypothetical protein [Limisphaerales bacterium]MCS1414641.1 hypothetical protein [Limisphaerales bacterium]